MLKCNKCDDTGVIETGNNDLPCDCEAGNTAHFNVAGIRGSVTGAEVKNHFLNRPRKISSSNEDSVYY